MGIVLGLTAAVCWGVADFLARYATRSIGTYRTLFLMQFIGFAGLSVYLGMTGELQNHMETADASVWVWVLVAALLNVAASLAIYRAFEIGVLALVSPIAASYAAITVILSVLSGETLSIHRTIGIGITLFGVVLASIATTPAETHPSAKPSGFLQPGVGWALVSAVAFGIGFWVLGIKVTPVLGGTVPVWFGRSTAMCVLPLLALSARQSLRIPRPGSVWWFILGVGIIDTAANLAAVTGYTTDQVAIVTVISSLFSVVTVLLAWIFLREKLHWYQWLGIAIIMGGVALVSAR